MKGAQNLSRADLRGSDGRSRATVTLLTRAWFDAAVSVGKVAADPV
jgi:hypothetical protein